MHQRTPRATQTTTIQCKGKTAETHGLGLAESSFPNAVQKIAEAGGSCDEGSQPENAQARCRSSSGEEVWRTGGQGHHGQEQLTEVEEARGGGERRQTALQVAWKYSSATRRHPGFGRDLVAGPRERLGRRRKVTSLRRR